jgi:ubiquinone/menaquinone biosynthesis C-methylase UbiE
MFRSFSHRTKQLERLDTGDYTEAEYELWLREMRWINRLAGDSRALKVAIRETLDGDERRVSILDVGAGGGELLKTAYETLGEGSFLVGAELNERAAKAIQGRSAEFGVHSIRCDAMHLPFADNSFDLVISSLFLHHLDDDQARSLLREMARVAARRLIVIDLHRHPIAYYFYRFFSRLVLQRFTQQDGALSIMRSYRPDELRELAADSKLADPKVHRSFPFRLVLSASPRTMSDGG